MSVYESYISVCSKLAYSNKLISSCDKLGDNSLCSRCFPD